MKLIKPKREIQFSSAEVMLTKSCLDKLIKYSKQEDEKHTAAIFALARQTLDDVLVVTFN